ncbi:MAG: DUF4097 family beta strand repeat-containing protein [Clostridia bacterium]|nr:DUF4097 family beta strand repeat-containing protein [Clostridia bacterium]
MSQSEERLLILKMLEEGKITSEEASKLLEALDGTQRQSGNENYSRQQKGQTYHEEIFKMRERINDWRKDIKNNYNQKDFDRMVEDFANKAEKVGKNLATTTFGIVDKMIDFVGSYVDTNAFNMFGSYQVIDRSFEAEVQEGMDLSVEGMNGSIVVKKHLDNKVIIKTRVRSPQENADAILMFNNTGNAATLALNKIGNISVSHEIFLPTVKFKNIKLETTNGRIYVEDSLSDVFEAITRNSHIELMGVNSDRISVSTKNAKIQISYLIGRDIDINTNNSVIDIKHIKAQMIKAVTMNGRITVENVQNYENSPEVLMDLKTSNGGIKVNMNDMDNKGYKVKAKTTNGGINLLIPEMTYYNVNRHGTGTNFIEAESNGYQGFAERVFINAETNNGYIEIVK